MKIQQNVSFLFPKSHELADLAISKTPMADNYVETNVPPALAELANEIIATSRKLRQLKDAYDYQWLTEKIKLGDLNRQENARLVQLERERKTTKEAERQRKREVSKMSKEDRRQFRLTGRTREEEIAALVEEFKVKVLGVK